MKVNFFALILGIIFILSNIKSQTTVTAGSGSITLEYVDEKSFKITIKGKVGSFIGLGFGRGHGNVDMHIVEFISSAKYNLYDSFSTREAAPPSDTQKGGTFDLENINYSTNGSAAEISYTRAYDTGDKYDAVLSPEKSFSFSVSWGTGTLHDHGHNRKITTVKISSTANNDPTTQDEDEHEGDEGGLDLDFWEFHGIALKAIWMPLNFLGYLSVRFFRYNHYWEWVHVIFTGLCSMIGIGIMGYSIKENNEEWSTLSMKIHITFGIILFSLTILEVFLGLIEWITIYWIKSVKSSSILNFKIFHKIIGIILTFTSYISIFTAGDLISSIIICGVFLGIIILFEIINFKRYSITQIENLNEFLHEYESKSLKKLRSFNLIQLLEEQKQTKYVLYDNYICDVGTYITYHPGGPMMIRDNLYLDVGRYLTGTQEYSKKFSPHNHNLSTFKHMMEKYCYGILKDSHMIVVEKNSDFNRSELSGLKLNCKYMSESYPILLKRRLIAKETYEYEFKSTQGIAFARILPNVSWMGRHFSLSSKKLNKTRYYSSSISLNDKMQELHLGLLENVKRLERKEEIVNLQIKDAERYSDTLCLHIKRYNYKNALSNHLFHLNTLNQTDLIIKGPLGVGLNIHDNILTGTYVVFAAGTGIIPFIDLITFTLRYMVYTISVNNFQNNSNFLMKNEDATYKDIVHPSFKIHLFVTFSNPESAIYMNVFQELEKLDQKYNLNVFKLTTRFSSEKTERWNKSFLDNNLSKIRKSINRIYLIGSVPFMEDIKVGLIETGIANNKQIIFV